MLAFHAWRGYQAEGRGALVLSEKELHTPDRYRPVMTHLLYLSERHPQFPGWPDRYIATAVQDYNPEREILVLINLREGGVVFHRIRQGPVDPSNAKPNAN